jgi:opacity protein-like surface antigen
VMRKLFSAAVLVAALAAAAVAQDTNPPSRGKAPTEPNGIGRLDARVVDEAGNPVRGVRLELESRRSDGFFCEAWDWTDADGAAVLTLHMGELRLLVKAKGYENQKLNIPAASLNDPVRVTLKKK